MKYETLKKLHRDERESFSEDFNIRIHRALSWLDKAEKENEDADSSFIFYWISFNASYTEMRTEVNLSSERIVIKSFLKKGGFFLVKNFQGEDTEQLFKEIKFQFNKAMYVKPNASDKKSKEIYILGLEKK